MSLEEVRSWAESEDEVPRSGHSSVTEGSFPVEPRVSHFKEVASYCLLQTPPPTKLWQHIPENMTTLDQFVPHSHLSNVEKK